jgi:hypothetical protein
MNIQLPNKENLPGYYQNYFQYITETDLYEALVKQKIETNNFLKTIPAEKEDFRYAPEKWMLKEVVGHVSDTERVLCYRAMRFSRNDSTVLSGFDENTYVPNSNFKNISLEEISEEKSAIRQSNILLFKNMNEEMLDRKGTANKMELSARALLFFIVAHERHHLKVIKERYL